MPRLRPCVPSLAVLPGFAFGAEPGQRVANHGSGTALLPIALSIALLCKPREYTSPSALDTLFHVVKALLDEFPRDFLVEDKELEQQSWGSLLDSLKTGVAYCVFAARVDDALDALQREAAYRLNSAPIVMLTWPDAPRIDQAIQDVAMQLAKATLAAVSKRQPAEPLEQDAKNDKWLDHVRWLLEAGRVPLPDGYPIADSFRRFAKTISPGRLTCILMIESVANARSAHLDGLCRGSQWIAQHTHGQVALLLNESLRGDPALASIDFYALTLHQQRSLSDSTYVDVCDDMSRSQFVEQKLRLWPYIGQPHPFSPGEQLLCAALSSHNLLAGRFTFNEVIETADSRRYIVDLVDRDLWIVVEVDGYRHHSSQAAFSADRDRDYRLLVSGYVVLRLAHHEVVSDVNAALKKIDTLVRHRQANVIQSMGLIT